MKEVDVKEVDVNELRRLEMELRMWGVAGREEFERVWRRVEGGEGRPGYWGGWAKGRREKLERLREEMKMEEEMQRGAGLKVADADGAATKMKERRDVVLQRVMRGRDLCAEDADKLDVG